MKICELFYFILNLDSTFSSWAKIFKVNDYFVQFEIFFSHWTFGSIVYHTHTPTAAIINISTHSSWTKFIIQLKHHTALCIIFTELGVLPWMSTNVQVEVVVYPLNVQFEQNYSMLILYSSWMNYTFKMKLCFTQGNTNSSASMVHNAVWCSNWIILITV